MRMAVILSKTILLTILSFFLLFNYIEVSINNSILQKNQPQSAILQYAKTITEIEYNDNSSKKAILVNKEKLIEAIDKSKLDIFLITKQNRILELRNEDIIAALFTVLLHESNFLKQKTNNSGDICYMQINRYYWNRKIRNALLDLDYMDKQILNNIEACIEAGIKVMLYNYALCKTNKKTDFEKLIVCYHSPYNKNHQTRYYNAIKKKIDINAIRNVTYKNINIYYIKDVQFQKRFTVSASNI